MITILKSEINKKKLNKNFKFIHMAGKYMEICLIALVNHLTKSKLLLQTIYSASKASAILILKTFINNFKFPGIITNCVNNFGHYQFVEKFIPRSILTAKEKGIIEVYGSGKNIRS